MEYDFGYNCEHYLPTLSKCRVLIDNYRKRMDLVEPKWLSAKDLLIYENLPNKELLRRIAESEIRAKLQKDGEVMYRISSAWQWDDCPLANNGGQCFYFKPHNGEKITCLIELKNLKTKHPNLKNIPSEEDIKTFESQAIEVMDNLKHG